MNTKKVEQYWRDKMCDWNTEYFLNRGCENRRMVISALSRIRFGSLLEIGCNCGPNMMNIIEAYPRAEIVGIDINSGAIEMARGLLPQRVLDLEVSTADDIPFSDKSTDVVLSYNLLMYIGDDKINKVMTEIKRVVRNHIIFFEPHSENAWEIHKTNIKKRHQCTRNYKKLLERYGFWDIKIEGPYNSISLITARI